MYSMDDDNRPLFTLTVAQYSRIVKKIFVEEFDKLIKERQEEANKNTQETNICDIDQAMKITRLAKSTLYSKVSKKYIPCLSHGKPLLFQRDHLEMWLKAGRPKTDSIIAIGELMKKKQHEERKKPE